MALNEATDLEDTTLHPAADWTKLSHWIDGAETVFAVYSVVVAQHPELMEFIAPAGSGEDNHSYFRQFNFCRRDRGLGAGNDVIDIRTLGNYGYFTYDPGFLATASCESAITFIDGGKGVLQHRGYPIDSLAKQADYLEVCYILLNGDAPTKAQYDEFTNIITNHTMVHEKLAHFFQGFLPDAHPMAMVCGVVGALSSFYHSDLDIGQGAS